MFGKILGSLIGLLAIVFLFALNALSPTIGGASGYAAKNTCSGHFISGFSADSIRSEALIGASPVLGLLTAVVNEDQRRVDAHFMGFFARRAVFNGDGTGCTLLASGQNELERPLVEPRKKASTTPLPKTHLDPADEDAFKAILNKAFAEETPEAPRNTKAVLILHKGHVIAEHYAEGVNAQTPLLGWSMNKSVFGLVAGLMVGDELINPAAKAEVEIWQQEANDLRAAITFDQLLRMSSGLTFNEYYGASSDVTYMLSNAPDAGRFAASMPLEFDPDAHWSYSSGTTNIISRILKEASGGTLQSHSDYIHARLFEPLGIETAILETDADGTFIGSSYGYASARDWARMGLFALQNGMWEGEQLLPDGWMTYVTTPTPTNSRNDYGAHFWLNQDPVDGSPRAWPSLPTDAYFFSGFQGQFVAVIPSQDLVVVRLGFAWRGNHGVEALIASTIKVTSQIR